MSAAILPFPARVEVFGGDDLRPGAWLYSHVPASESDALLVVQVEGDDGPVAYDVLGGFRPLPRTRVLVRCDGGEGRERWIEHLSTDSLRAYREHNGLTGYFGFLAEVYTDTHTRAAFVERCRQAPARREQARFDAEAEVERLRVEVGPWFADLEDVISGRIPDTVEAKVIRRCLREIVGVTARVTVRRYSMASGLDLRPPKGRDGWADVEGARIAALFPGLAWASRHYDRDTGQHRDGWRVDDSAHPHAREDRSDSMSDYHCPGGFRVGPAFLLDVCRILAEEAS